MIRHAGNCHRQERILSIVKKRFNQYLLTRRKHDLFCFPEPDQPRTQDNSVRDSTLVAYGRSTTSKNLIAKPLSRLFGELRIFRALITEQTVQSSSDYKLEFGLGLEYG